MKSFRDTTSREWLVQINTAAIKRCRNLLQVDLLSVLDDECRLLAQLHDDPVLLVDVLYCLCQPEAETRQITDEQFGQAFSGDVLLNAHTALLEELRDFFPDARQRQVFDQLIQKMRALTDRILEHAEQSMAAIDPESAAQSAIASFGKSPGRSVSTPVPSRSES